MNIVAFPRSAEVPVAPLPETVASHHARNLEIIEGMSGFVDRIGYAQQVISDCHVLLFNGVIDWAQCTGMLMSVHDLLRVDLGIVCPT